MPGLNLFAYGSEDDESDEKEIQTTLDKSNPTVSETGRYSLSHRHLYL